MDAPHVSNSQNQRYPARQVAPHLDTPRIQKRPKSAPSQLGTCIPQDLTPSVLNQIARRDLHWILLPVEHVYTQRAIWCRRGLAKNRDRELIKQKQSRPRVD
jgi:hypothetical protein